MLNLAESPNGVTFTVHVTPRSSKTEIVGEHDGALKIKLKSRPVEGAANEELVRFLAKSLGVPRGDVEIVSGAASRTKRVRVASVDRAQIIDFAREKSA